ncbi:MAG: T9SS type A sorting domain-containing protein [Bacteroidales bacterium]|nr:T9SS type A sorting domain-containing protein [Bacteroidales bacterium]
MKRIILLLCFTIALKIYSQDTIFFDDFENGLNNWITTGQWGLTTLQSHSPTHSLTESPNGNYGNNWNTYCVMKNGLNLVHYPNATLSFWATFKIETGFDYMYVEVSKDNFQTYEIIATFNGEQGSLPPFQQYTFSLGAFCGFNNVKIRFRFCSDQGYVTDGMYIDDFLITYSLEDNIGPLISHQPLPFMQGSLYDHNVVATILDYSGINQNAVKCFYSVDNSQYQFTSGTYIGNSKYSFTIPAQQPGALVKYYFYAEDNSPNHNTAYSDTFAYIAGNHIIQDNGQVDYFMRLQAGQGAAVRITLNNTSLVGMLIRNYVDINNPNDSMLVHVWNDNNGAPGTDVITPIKVYPAATLVNTSPMTWIDLRPYSSELSNLNGTYYIGFTVPQGFVNITITQPGLFNSSFFYNGSTWQTSSGLNGSNDHHFRAITSEVPDTEGPIIINQTVPVHYEASPDAQQITALITDISGVASSTLYYQVDNLSVNSINGVNVGSNYWQYIIPPQPAGSWVKYWIQATDMAQNPHTSQTDTFTYVSGKYVKHDNGTPNVYIPVGSMYNTFAAIALKLDFDTIPTTLTTLLIRNYYSVNYPSNTPNDPMRIHVWTNNNGMPGDDIIPPFIVNSEAGPNSPLAFTRVDLRNYSSQLSNLTGTIYVGFTVDNGMCAVLGDTNGYYNRTFIHDWSTWQTYGTDAFIRAVVGTNQTSEKTNLQNYYFIYPNPISDYLVLNTNSNNVNISIYDIYGKELLAKEKVSGNRIINVSNLPKGLFFVKIKDGTNIIVKKIVKK